MSVSRLAGAVCRKTAASPVLVRSLLASALLMSAAFQPCPAVSVPGITADTGKAESSSMLPESADADSRPRDPGVDARGEAVAGRGQEGRSGASLVGKRPPGSGLGDAEGDADDRLFLFALLGFAAIAAWVADWLGRRG